jgi:hypothetical protein
MGTQLRPHHYSIRTFIFWFSLSRWYFWSVNSSDHMLMKATKMTVRELNIHLAMIQDALLIKFNHHTTQLTNHSKHSWVRIGPNG